MASIFEPVEYAGPESPAPEWITPDEIIKSVADALLPPSRMTVDVAAEKSRMIFGRGVWSEYDNSRAPYMIEPQRMITRRSYKAECFVGPARSSKSASLIENPIAHAIAYDPKPIILYQISVELAKKYSDGVIGPMVRNSPDLAARLRTDNLYQKDFSGGTSLAIGWPVGSQVASVTARLLLMTDYDKMPLDVEGEGSMFKLGSMRAQTEGSGAMTVVESSPRRQIQKENWKASTPHEAPPCQGILSIYNEGTRGRFYYKCPHCGQLFEPTFNRLQYDRDAATPQRMGATVVLVCPHNGCVMVQSDRRALNLAGEWLHETEDGDVAPLGERTRETDIVSHWLMGPPAWATTWAELVTIYEAALAKKEKLSDDTDYKSVMNTRLAQPVLPSVAVDAEDLDEEQLKAQATDDPVGVAPEWVRFVTIAVDTQKSEFIWQAVAHGPDGERLIFDRGSLFQAPEGSPGAGKRPIDPAKYPQDWHALDALREKEWPVAETGATIRAVIGGVDMQGRPGVSDRARTFWRREKKQKGREFWQLIRGRPGYHLEKRAWRARPESASKGKAVRRDVPILNIATDKMKDESYAGLALNEGRAPKAIMVCRGHEGEIFSELASERSTPKGWRKKPGVVNNESWDLVGYNSALAIILQAEKIDWTAPPSWALEWGANSLVKRVEAIDGQHSDDDVDAAEQPEPKKKTKPAKRRRGLKALQRLGTRGH